MSLSNNPAKWEGQTRDFLRDQHFKQTKQHKEFTFHWRPNKPYKGLTDYWMVATEGEGQDLRVVATLFYGPVDETGEPTPDGKAMEGAVEVDPGYRRRGLATAMYNWGEQLSGLRFQPAQSHTNDAEAFWQARKKHMAMVVRIARRAASLV